MHPRSPIACLALTAVCLLGVAAAPAPADIVLELRNGNTVAGELAEGGGAARFVIELPQGARLTATAKTARKSPPVSLVLLDESDMVLATGKDGARSSAVARFDAPETSRYAIEVKARDGASATGYTVTVGWKTPPRVTLDSQATPDGGTATFAGDAGSTFTGTVRAGRGSAVVPRIVRLEGPGGFSLDAGATNGATKAAASTLRGVVLPQTGEYVLSFEDDADAGGAVRTEIRLQQTVSRERVEVPPLPDLGGTEPGETDDGVTAPPAGVGRIVGPAGASIEITADPALDPQLTGIVGAGILIPRLALPAATAIVLATSKPILPVDIGLGGGEVLIASGPAVFFGPEGTEFDVPVTITIPIDATAAARPADVFVLTRTASGATSRIENVTVSAAERTVTFPATHFSSFQAFVRGVPRSPQKLVPAGTSTLGTAVALDGDTLVVTDPGTQFTPGQAFIYRFVERQWLVIQRIVAPDLGLMGRSAAIDGDTLLLGGSGAGYVYVRSSGVWTFQQKLHTQSGAAGGTLDSCDIDGDTAVLGARFAASSDGEVYVFVRSGDQWTVQQRLITPETASIFDYFGSGVSIEGDRLAVGAPYAGASLRGGIYLFDRSAGAWSHSQTISSPGLAFSLGETVALRGGLLVSSAFEGPSRRTFVYDVGGGGSPTLEATLTPSAPSNTAGQAIALSGDTLVLGAPFESSAAGAAFVYVRTAGTWTFQQKLTPVGARFATRMGTSVAIDGDRIVLGAPGDSRDDAAYGFERVAGDWTR